LKQINHIIGGREVATTSGRTSPVYNPATGEVTAHVGLATVEEVDLAVGTAKAAAVGWSAMSLAKRTGVMYSFRDLLERHKHDIAALLTAEHGKVLSDSLGEIQRGIENVEYACGLAEHLKGSFSQEASTDIDVYSVRQPLGVVAGITPFNFPSMVPMWMFPNAIAAGNAFILKPSEKDPSVNLLTAELLDAAGLPAGVFNIVQGDKVAVDRILQHRDIAAISFVGSTPIAKYVYATGTSAGKRVQALGGAKNHMVVLPDADIGLAADAAVSAGYGSAGERCMAISVVVAVGSSADPLVAAIKERIPGIVVGDGTDAASEMGPLITEQHRDRVASFVANAPAEGATVVVDGRTGTFDGEGFFLEPTLLDHVSPGMACYDEEIFGPVLGVVRVGTYEEALKLVEDSPYGNGTAIFTRDGGAARRFQIDVDAGMVGINVPVPVPVGYYSFGGWGESLFGNSHAYGPEGIGFYTKAKVVTSRWSDPATSTIDLGFPQNV
jgi:malonate-semialdehyde dehydrogenase (acetylating)/methylmalonate-semialdehyde dehydrogenase